MAYTKTTWNCGDEISAERMNNIEDGIEEALAGGVSGGNVDVVNVTVSDASGSFEIVSVSKTFEDMAQIVADGKLLFANVMITGMHAPYNRVLYCSSNAEAIDAYAMLPFASTIADVGSGVKYCSLMLYQEPDQDNINSYSEILVLTN